MRSISHPAGQDGLSHVKFRLNNSIAGVKGVLRVTDVSAPGPRPDIDMPLEPLYISMVHCHIFMMETDLFLQWLPVAHGTKATVHLWSTVQLTQALLSL